MCVLRILTAKDKILSFSDYNTRIYNFLKKLAITIETSRFSNKIINFCLDSNISFSVIALLYQTYSYATENRNSINTANFIPELSIATCCKGIWTSVLAGFKIYNV